MNRSTVKFLRGVFVSWMVLFSSAALSQDLEAFEEQVTEFTLDNGLHFIIIERDVAPVASFFTFVNVGSVNEPVNHTGIAHIFEHMVFKGSDTIGTTDFEAEQEMIRKTDDAYRAWLDEKYSPDPDESKMEEHWADFQNYREKASAYVVTNEFDEIVSREGAQGLNAFTSADGTGYFYSLPQNKAELWFSLEAERFRNPVFREFYEEKDVIMEERRMRTDSDPIGRLLEEFVSVAYSAHPYRNPVIGWPSDITATTIRDTQDFFETFYVPSSFTIAIAGDVDPERMRDLAETYFGGIEAGDPPPQVTTLEPAQRGERRFTIEDDSQPFFISGYHTVDQMHPDWAALQLAGSIIAEGRTSRLYRRMIQDEQLALQVGAFNGFPGSKYAAMFLAYAAPNMGVALQDIESVIQEEIDKVKAGDITREELDRAVTNARAGLLRSLNSNMGLANNLASTHAQQGDWRRVFTYLEDLENVTLQDLERVANEYLLKENRTVGKIINRGSAGNAVPAEEQ